MSTPPRILIVDDNAVTSAAMRRALQSQYAIDVAPGGAEALALLRSITYDLILCDLVMPGVSGLQLIELLAEERSPALARLVLTTGTTCTAAEARRLAACGVQILYKPVGNRELTMLVEGYLARAAAEGDRA